MVLEPTGIFSDPTNPAQRYFHILQEECDRATNLINNLLNLSQLESGQRDLTLTTIQLQIWLPSILQPFDKRCHQQRQTLSIHCVPDLFPIHTDITYLERILVELLTNACKYTPPYGHIQIRVEAHRVGRANPSS
ncbi:MAG: HAMP domain-containing histidine kinase [Synechococcales cyanobacterium T60_A2020_003]|nr:HAMP domain-containing histidine kinase [Synechococcales cyanobacterium T60_A2020_003]